MNPQSNQAIAFLEWAECLGELIFWARVAGAENCMTDEWREKYRIDIQDKGSRARDAARDDVTYNQFSLSRRLACDLVRMLITCGDLNSVPCRTWPATERNIVDDLSKLKSRFTELGNGENEAKADTAPAAVADNPATLNGDLTEYRYRSPAQWAQIFKMPGTGKARSRSFLAMLKDGPFRWVFVNTKRYGIHVADIPGGDPDAAPSDEK